MPACHCPVPLRTVFCALDIGIFDNATVRSDATTSQLEHHGDKISVALRTLKHYTQPDNWHKAASNFATPTAPISQEISVYFAHSCTLLTALQSPTIV